jgi:hypothetical protein
MQAFIEMTKWDDGKEYPHVYWMDDSKNRAYAYARWGNPNDTQVFKKPIQIDTRGRKFEPVQNIYGWQDPNAQVDRVWVVKGSKGDEYTVTEDSGNFNCSCSGFRFRGTCKHVESIRQTV